MLESWLRSSTIIQSLALRAKVVLKSAEGYGADEVAGQLEVCLRTVYIWQIWKTADLRPHHLKNFKISNDPNFAEKAIDIAGLYMNPPDKAPVLPVEKLLGA